MKKTIFLAAAVIGFNLAASAQFSDDGFKSLKMGTPVEVFMKKNEKFVLKEDKTAKIKYGGISLKVEFGEYDYAQNGKRENGLFLQSIQSTSEEATLLGVSENLIGKKYEEVEKTLGSQMEDMWAGMEEGISFPTDRWFYAEGKEINKNFSCILSFNDDGVLESISVYPNP